MSTLYSVDLTLDIKFTRENVRFILQKCFEEEVVFLAQKEDKDFFVMNSYCLSLEQAAIKMFMITEEVLLHGGPFLYGKFQDTDFFIWFFKKENELITLSFGSFCPRWDKDFSCGGRMYTIDFARYVRLMLQVCKEMTLLELNGSSDETEDLIYVNKNYVTAAIDIGFFKEEYQGGTETARESMQGLLRNALQNNFIFFDEKMENQIEPSVQCCYDTLKAEFPVYLYAKVDDLPFKIEIKKNERTYDFVSIYPLEPYRMKKGYGSEEEKIDLAFYIKRLIELCENFAIYELKTFM